MFLLPAVTVTALGLLYVTANPTGTTAGVTGSTPTVGPTKKVGKFPALG